MDMVLILVQQILVMVAMMSIGIALVKTKMLNSSGVGQLSNIAMYVATPAVIIQAFAIDYSKEQLVNGLWVAAFFSLALLISAIVAYFVCGSADKVGQYTRP